MEVISIPQLDPAGSDPTQVSDVPPVEQAIVDLKEAQPVAEYYVQE